MKTRFYTCIGRRPYEDLITSLSEALRRAIRPPQAHNAKPDKLQRMQTSTTGSAPGQVRSGTNRSSDRRRCWEAQLRLMALDAKMRLLLVDVVLAQLILPGSCSASVLRENVVSFEDRLVSLVRGQSCTHPRFHDVLQRLAQG